MSRILCFFGIHKYGKQFNIREEPIDGKNIPFIAMPLAVLVQCLAGPPKVCERKCLRCYKVKTFDYDRDIGE